MAYKLIFVYNMYMHALMIRGWWNLSSNASHVMSNVQSLSYSYNLYAGHCQC